MKENYYLKYDQYKLKKANQNKSNLKKAVRFLKNRSSLSNINFQKKDEIQIKR